MAAADQHTPTHSPDARRTAPLPLWLRAGLLGVIISGVLLRVVCPEATVFCNDQARACALAADVANGHWPTAGLVNSGEFRNLPGLGYLLGTAWKVWPHPLTLLTLITGLNVLALLGSAWLTRRWFGSTAAWWATAFFASAPWAIQYCRWIWGQDLLFPAALVVYAALGAWLCAGRRWASAAVVLGVTAIVHLHLAGVVLGIAVAILLLWRRPRLPAWPIGAALVMAAVSVLPYLLAGHLTAPTGQRTGYEHFWRSVPAALMSLSGLLWQLEFKGGYAALAESMSWRLRVYQAAMVVPVLLFLSAGVAGLVRAWRERRVVARGRLTPLMLVVALVVLIPTGFSVVGIRTSPTYLPVWYPLPFMLIGWFVARAGRGEALSRGTRVVRRTWQAGLFAVMLVQMTFFAEQLRYVRAHGGVPGSILDRAYGPLAEQVAGVARTYEGREVWMVYAGASPIMDEACAFLFRGQDWSEATGGRVLIRFDSWPRGGTTVQRLPAGVQPPAEAYQVFPWAGPAQVDGVVPRRAAGQGVTSG